MCKATLNNALFILEYPTNMFSVHEATKPGSTVTFGPNESKLTTEDGKQFNIVQNGKLFYLETGDKSCAVKEHSLKDLHVMMGHCHISDLRKLRTVVNGIKIKDPNADFFLRNLLQGQTDTSTCKQEAGHTSCITDTARPL